MADLMDESFNQYNDQGGNNSELNRLLHNPMFMDLQSTLMSDMNTRAVPYSLQNFVQHQTPSKILYHDGPGRPNTIDDEVHRSYYHNLTTIPTDCCTDLSCSPGERTSIDANNNDYGKCDYHNDDVEAVPAVMPAEGIDHQHEQRDDGVVPHLQPEEPVAKDDSNHITLITDDNAKTEGETPVIGPRADHIVPPLQPLHEIVTITPNMERVEGEYTNGMGSNGHYDALTSANNETYTTQPTPNDENYHSQMTTPANADDYHLQPTTNNSEYNTQVAANTEGYQVQPITNNEEYNNTPLGTNNEGYNRHLVGSAEEYVPSSTQTDKSYFPAGGPAYTYNSNTYTRGNNEDICNESYPAVKEGFDLLVEDATLQAEFRQMAPLGNEKVTELETFYNTQCAQILTQRRDAVTRLQARGLDPGALDIDLKQLNMYFNKQQEHLVIRISQSLQLFKESLPSEKTPQIPTGGAKKQSKSRLLNSKAVTIMNKWYQDHIEYPYPSDEQKQQLAEDGGISLAQAASFGKCFLTDYQPETFVHMCQMLRVLNAVRDSNLGIPLTYSQLKHLSLVVLIDRLVLRRQYCLAIEICKYLKLPESEGASRILAHWACYKVQQTGIDDETVARAIAAKLGDTPGVSYSEIANKAIECGRTQLAVRLLDYEPRAVEQVPLLMKMKKNREALNKAIESGDTDLVFTVVLQLKETLGLGEFLMAIRGYPTAYALFLQYCREQNRKLLQDIYEQEDQYIEEANCRVWESYQEERLDARLSCLKAAQDSYSKGRNDWAAKQTEEEMRLLKTQRKLETDYNRPYVDLSLHETIYRLIQENNQKWPEQLRKDFKIPDRRFWWLKVQALAEAGDWLELEKLSKSKKSPIGYDPFVEVCVKYQRIPEAEKYIQKVLPENKVKCLVKMGKFNDAAETAFQLKDIDGLNLVQQKCNGDKDVIDRVNRLKAQFSGR